MQDILDQLKYLKDSGSLATLYRIDIDDSPIHGYVLDYSPKLTLIRREYDFYLDGFYVVNTGDISSAESTETGALHHRMIEEAGMLDNLMPAEDRPLTNWKDFLDHLSASNPIVILEAEYPDSENNVFLIGRIAHLTDYEVHVWHFDGTGEWGHEPGKISFDHMTCCQLSTNYANMYQAYFKRHPELDHQ